MLHLGSRDFRAAASTRRKRKEEQSTVAQPFQTGITGLQHGHQRLARERIFFLRQIATLAVRPSRAREQFTHFGVLTRVL